MYSYRIYLFQRTLIIKIKMFCRKDGIQSRLCLKLAFFLDNPSSHRLNNPLEWPSSQDHINPSCQLFLRCCQFCTLMTQQTSAPNTSHAFETLILQHFRWEEKKPVCSSPEICLSAALESLCFRGASVMRALQQRGQVSKSGCPTEAHQVSLNSVTVFLHSFKILVWNRHETGILENKNFEMEAAPPSGCQVRAVTLALKANSPFFPMCCTLV